jgi:hypothetical protein
MPEIIAGYHGCGRTTAELLLQGTPFVASENTYDWLGRGVYFWEEAATRAREWARTRFQEDTAVIKADIVLGHCLNLFDTEHFAGLQAAYLKAVNELQRLNLPIPENKNKRHELDRLVVDFYCRDYAFVGGQPFQTVRGCFPEGQPVYEGSRIRRETHIQVAVRDQSCITRVVLVE